MDFYCASEKLIIEIDGSHHYTLSGEIADRKRDEYLQDLGMRILRFPNEVIQHKFHIVVETIRGAFLENR